MSTDLWLVIVTAVGIVVALIQGVWLFIVQRRTARIDSMEASLKKSNEEAIDSRFKLISMSVEGAARELRQVIEGVQDRLTRGDHAFERQETTAKELEVTAITREAAIKEWAREAFGSREEMSATIERLAGVELKMAETSVRLAHLEARHDR